MIIRNNFDNTNDYIEKEKEGIKKAVKKLDNRYQNKEIDLEKFLKQNEIFAKRHEKLKKMQDNLNKK